VARKLSTSGRDRGLLLADFLAERLGVDRSEAVTLVRDGGVYVDRSRIEDPSHRLQAGQRITVHETAGAEHAAEPSRAPSTPVPATPADLLTPSPTPRPGSPQPAAVPAPVPKSSPESRTPLSEPAPGADASIAIAYQDADVLIVDKPAGVPSQATRERSRGALDRIIQRTQPHARLLHRLDRDASGLVLFTRTPDAQRRFAELLRDGLLARRYVAVAWGHVTADAGRLDRPIGPDPGDRRRMAAGHGRPALTHFRVTRRGRAPDGAPTTLLEIDLATGRTHQIRVHLSDAGHPLCGDRLYGPAPEPAAVPRLCLHAGQLAWPDTEPILSPVPAWFDDLVAAT
jgi:RluA family pseudouridine synthase